MPVILINIQKSYISKWKRPAIFAENSIVIFFSVHSMRWSTNYPLIFWPLYLLADIKVEFALFWFQRDLYYILNIAFGKEF